MTENQWYTLEVFIACVLNVILVSSGVIGSIFHVVFMSIFLVAFVKLVSWYFGVYKEMDDK